MKTRTLRLALLLACTAFASPLLADDLADGFQNPPQSARPRVWWHWMNGNVTKDGIEKDLDWMARMGIGGVQNFDANLATPQIVPQRLPYMTPLWKEAFAHAVRTADAKGLEFAIASSPGWSETGGPWVKPEDAMKKLVWAETTVRGGRRVTGTLPQPPATVGPFQNAPLAPTFGGSGGSKKLDPLYRDVRLLAYPAKPASLPRPQMQLGDGTVIDAAALDDGDLNTTADIATGTVDQPGTLILDYGKPVTVRAANLFIPNAKPVFGDYFYHPTLEAEQGGEWRQIGDFPMSEAGTTIAFPAVTARRFRVAVRRNQAPRGHELGDAAPGAIAIDFSVQPSKPRLAIGSLQLSAEPRLDRFEAKAGFTVVRDYTTLPAGSSSTAGSVDPSKVLDISSHLRPDGTLDWVPPAGSDWRILRLGYSLLGKTNHPATKEATGLEVDKYDSAAVRRYIETYLSMYRDAVGPGWIGAKGIRALLTDSIEVGPSNWTPRMVEEFTARRGYDPLPYLPALTGAIVGSPARSDAFLHDYRQTLADLLADAHYGTIAKVAHENGLIVYGEALEDMRPVLGDDLTMRRHADVPMAALWTWNRDSKPRPTLLGDMKGAASVAHIYGQNIVAAESMTSMSSPWAFAPSDLKRIIDLEFAYGINRPIVHTSVHQPVDDKVPGLSLLIFGQYFNRHESWAEMARPWVDYMARSSYLLQQGRDHADVAWFYGEDAPITALFASSEPAGLPKGYGYDFVNADILANVLKVEDGQLVAPGGARYRALYLGGSSRVMTLPTLRRIAAIADAGIPVIGEAPQRDPAMKGDPTEFAALVDRLWKGTTTAKPRITPAQDIDAGLARIGIAPDFRVTGGASDSDYRFVHRTLPDGELYFVNNRQNRAEKIEARFRVTGRQPEIWRAIDGTAKPVSYRTEGQETVIPLDVGAEDAFFILFRKPATSPAASIATPAPQQIATLDQPWQVSFQPGRGAPATLPMPQLMPLNEAKEDGVRYFSGIATYTSRFTLPKGAKRGNPLWLDLGKVGDLAEVHVNGKPAGTSWFAPYRVDIGPFVKSGSNKLEVKVANLWVNRLIGDKQPEAERIAFTAAPTYKRDAPLRPSGLIGPVTLWTER